MTQEEKFEEAKRLYQTANQDQRYVLESLFHELAESEDEKIRKFIIKQLFKVRKTIVYNSNLDRELANAIAWLEKQGESSIKWNKNIEGNKPQVNHSVLMKTTHGIAEGEWQGEQWHQYRWACIVRDTDVLSWIELSSLEKQGEKKPFDYENANIQQKDFAPKVEPKFKVKYAGSEYNVLEIKEIAGITYYGIEDEPNHIDYVKAENCEIISVYAIKENGSPYPTKPAVFSEQKPQRMISAEAKEAIYDRPAWSEEDEVNSEGR